MSATPRLTRRAALAGAATLPLAASLGAPARADGHMAGLALPKFQRFNVGDFQVTTLLVGSRAVEGPQNIFGMNVDAETFAEVSQAAHLPTDVAQFFFTPTLVNTGSELILFDTGLAPAGTVAALEAAGHSAAEIDKVVITHMHGDHVGGLMEGETETFGNAAYMTGQVEFDAWSKMENETFQAKVAPLAEKMSFLGDGGTVASGVTGMAAFGHTPGHMVYRLESGGQQLMICADFANHYVWSLAHPDWEVKFDMDKEAAAQTRRRLLDMLAAEGLPFIGYHMPFPALGYVEKAGEGYGYVPHSYQLFL
jgi:glyoxylase-like metal-dependent hydrolase (beta-lactamase superfamily II)